MEELENVFLSFSELKGLLIWILETLNIETTNELG